MVKRLIAELIIKGALREIPEEDVITYTASPIPTTCENNGITINIIDNSTYNGEPIIQYDGCNAKIKYWSVPSENYFNIDAYGEILFPASIDKNNVRLRFYAKTTSFGGNSEVSSCTGQIAFPSIVYVSGGWGYLILGAKTVGCETGETAVYLFLEIDYITSGYQVYDELFLPNGFDEWLIYEIAVSKDNFKAEIIIKDIDGNILKSLSADLDPTYWNSNLEWYIWGDIYGNSSVYGLVTEEWGINLDIMKWEAESYYG